MCSLGIEADTHSVRVNETNEKSPPVGVPCFCEFRDADEERLFLRLEAVTREPRAETFVKVDSCPFREVLWLPRPFGKDCFEDVFVNVIRSGVFFSL